MTNIIGQCLCCNTVPSFGLHNLHVWQGRRENGFGFYCEKCQKAKSILDSGMHCKPVPHHTTAYALAYWNRCFSPWSPTDREVKKVTINAPDGFEWAELQWTNSFIGGETNDSFPFVLVRTTLAKSKYDDKSLSGLEIMNLYGDSFDFSELLTRRNVSAYLSEVSCLGGNSTVHRSVRFSFYNCAHKHTAKFQEALAYLKIVKKGD